MPSYPRPRDETVRLARLDEYQIFGSPPEADYDEIVEFAAGLFGVSACLIAITGETEHWIKARRNFPRQTLSRAGAFCCYALAAEEGFVCLDSHNDARFARHALVLGAPHIRFYAGVPIVDADGVRLGVFCIVDDKPREAMSEAERASLGTFARIVAAKLDDRRRARSGAIASGFAEASALAIVTTDHLGRVTFWNGAAERMFGRDRDAVVGRSIELMMPERFRREHAAGLKRMSEGDASRLSGKSVEVVGLRGDGQEFPIEMSISSWLGPLGPEFGAHIQDISARKTRQLRLEHLAHHDPLTGLLNRQAFEDRLKLWIGEGGRAALLRLDIDAFKIVNDTLGHAVGDALLQAAALRLRSFTDPEAVIARFESDDFVLLIEDDDLTRAQTAAEELIKAFDAPFLVGQHGIRLTAAIGIALAPAHADDAEELLARSELAMLRSKTSEATAYRLFDASMANHLAARRAFKDELRRATIERQWELFYQPQVSLEDGALAGFEALLRWRHPERGLLTPAAFLSTLEQHLIAYDVGCWTLNEACRQLAEWRASGWSAPRVSVNLFAAQFHAGSLEAEVDAALGRHGLDPCDLELEVTETIALRADDKTRSALARLRRSGVGVAFDDFGTGFASLATLKQFPVSRLKVDKSFVADLDDSSMSRAIVGAVLSISQNLELDVIAEGVETDAQRRALLDLGCRWGQGYLYSKPVSASEAQSRYGGASAGLVRLANAAG